MPYSVTRVTVDKLAKVLEELEDLEPEGVEIVQIDFVGGRDYVVIAQGDCLPRADRSGDTPPVPRSRR